MCVPARDSLERGREREGEREREESDAVLERDRNTGEGEKEMRRAWEKRETRQRICRMPASAKVGMASAWNIERSNVFRHGPGRFLFQFTLPPG